MKKLAFFCMSLLPAVALTSCTDGLDQIEYTQYSGIEASMPNAAAVTGSSITVKSSVGGDIKNVVKTGFCYSLNSQNPTIKDNVVDADENFTATISGLTGNTTYYVRAYVYGNSRYTYSETIAVTTAEQSLEEQFEKYVAPTYVDDYTSMADWSRRNEWNLANVHDPSVMKAEDGYYYMYQTDASYGNAHEGNGHFHCRRSKDLVNWEYMGATMNDAPEWVKTELNKTREAMGLQAIDSPQYGYWAPVVRKVRDGLYRMYYSIVVDNYIKTGVPNGDANFDGSWTERAYIGLMETTDPSSNVWTDKGMVVCSASDKNMSEWNRKSLGDWNAYFYFNAIDPTYIITEGGEHWMIYGSWHSGFAALELDPATGKPLHTLGAPWNIFDDASASESAYGKLVAKRNNSRWQSSEGPDVVYNPETGYYYMFIAYGQLAVAYNTRVVRSENPYGPYKDMMGNEATSGQDMYPAVTAPYKFEGSNGWVGISHCGVFDDGEGNWFYSSQGRFPKDVPGINASNAIMMGHVRSILWTNDGWPVVMPERYGAVPQVQISQAELVGKWELIQFKPNTRNSTNDDNAVQYQSVQVTLAEDGSVVSEAWGDGATWTYDSEKNIISIGNNKIYIQREVDWEKNPRTATIVGGGYENSGKTTNWMKKIQ